MASPRASGPKLDPSCVHVQTPTGDRGQPKNAVLPAQRSTQSLNPGGGWQQSRGGQGLEDCMADSRGVCLGKHIPGDGDTWPEAGPGCGEVARGRTCMWAPDQKLDLAQSWGFRFPTHPPLSHQTSLRKYELKIKLLGISGWH